MQKKHTQIAVEAVIFDLWGTLIYNLPEPTDYNEVAAKVGIAPRIFWETWRKYSRAALLGEIKSSEERARRVLTELHGPVEAIPYLTQVDFNSRSANINFYPGVPEMLTNLRQQGFRTALISNCNYMTPNVINKIGLPEKIDEIILSCEVGAAKPDERIFQIAVERLQLKPRQCLYVGDGGDNEMIGATRFGFHTAIVEQERGHAFRFPGDFGTDFRFASVADVLQYVRKAEAA